MQSQIQIEETEPSYNGYVVPESIELATALDQYWLERRALCEQSIERYSVAAGDTAAERDWQSFCSHGTSFLNKYVSKAADSIDAPLREHWRCSFSMARECERTQFSEGHVFLLGATSNPDQIDPEVLDFFQERMAVTLPNRDARIKLFTRLLTDKNIDFSLDDGAVLLAELTEGKSLDSRDIENSVQAAQQKALLRAVRNGGPEHYSIALDDFEPLHTK